MQCRRNERIVRPSMTEYMQAYRSLMVTVVLPTLLAASFHGTNENEAHRNLNFIFYSLGFGKLMVGII